MGHFRIFGSSVYFGVIKDAWKKLELRADLGIFVGYTDTPHNYHVYLPTSRRTVVHIDLKLDEQKAMRLSLRGSSNYRLWRSYWFLRRRSLRLMWSSYMQRFQEWIHPLKESLPEIDGSAQEKLTDC